MTTPAESVEESIFANVKSELEEITAGSTFWYTPGIVTRTDQFTRKLFETPKKIVYLVRDTSEWVISAADREFGKNAKTLTIFVLAGFHDDRADDNAHTMSAPTKGTIRHRMMRDIEIKLDEDVTRGGNALWTETGDATKDFEEGVSGWILVELPINVTYTHDYSTP